MTLCYSEVLNRPIFRGAAKKDQQPQVPKLVPAIVKGVRFLSTYGNEYNVHPTVKSLKIENSNESCDVTNSWNFEGEIPKIHSHNQILSEPIGEELEIKEKEGFGLKIMLQQGYKEGQGLGRNNNGIVSPIDVEFKADTLGLGYH